MNPNYIVSSGSSSNSNRFDSGNDKENRNINQKIEAEGPKPRSVNSLVNTSGKAVATAVRTSKGSSDNENGANADYRLGWPLATTTSAKDTHTDNSATTTHCNEGALIMHDNIDILQPTISSSPMRDRGSSTPSKSDHLEKEVEVEVVPDTSSSVVQQLIKVRDMINTETKYATNTNANNANNVSTNSDAENEDEEEEDNMSVPPIVLVRVAKNARHRGSPRGLSRQRYHRSCRYEGDVEISVAEARFYMHTPCKRCWK
jgi:hypothetical protein